MKTTPSITIRLCIVALFFATLTSASAQITYSRLQRDGSIQIHQMRADGSADQVINLPWAKVGFPTWSQDGVQLAVSAFQPTNVPTRTWNVFGIFNSTAVIRRLTNYHDLLSPDNGAVSYTFPWYKAYSRDGTALATFSLTQSGGAR